MIMIIVFTIIVIIGLFSLIQILFLPLERVTFPWHTKIIFLICHSLS